MPDVAVLDLQMPGADGVKVATSLRSELPGCRVLIVTGHGRPGHLKRALAAGVRGFVPKTVSAQRLAEIIRTVHAGNRYVDPELAADAISAGDSPLTAREAEVLELAADGAPVAEIAERAALSQGTVRTTCRRPPRNWGRRTGTPRCVSRASEVGYSSSRATAQRGRSSVGRAQPCQG
ncbi:Transcriptional regulatory protein desR [Streptomyces leeuwenhoekii]|uniref:Transcriptional regulatory protein desR n=1 Tax=Streptomyces leeuwenhoekii TaxID=1437453 RepID=A0A0F7W2F3_STRLW|nr:Transcriptional regulatory protein desR [Streptomyces leeuwenhoekii]